MNIIQPFFQFRTNENAVVEEKPITPSLAASIIDQAAISIKEGKGTPLNGTRGLEIYTDKINNINFFAVRVDQQAQLNFNEVKKHIWSELKIHPDTEMVEIVGDSGLFSKAGTLAAKKFLDQFLTEKEYLVEYGYTGHGQNNDSRMDVNQCVSSWIDAKPARGAKSLANVISFTTPEVIRKFNCNVSSSCRNFFLVIGEDKFGFGSDIISSDTLPKKGICLEGGAQSFAQVMNMLEQNAEIHVLWNLRDPSLAKNFDADTGKIPTFSCGEFLYMLKQETNLNKEKVEEFVAKYFSTHVLNNKNKYDANDKAGLFSLGIQKLIDKEIWKKLDLVQFHQS